MAVTINGTNGIGVGTTPSHPLDIEVSSGDGVARIHAAENSNSSEARLRLEVSNDFAESILETYDSSGIGGSLKYNHGDNAWRFSTTGDSERMRIDSNGNVGIGTSTIADDADHCKLAISGQNGTAAGILIFQATNGDEDGMVFADDGNLFLVADRANATSSSNIIFRVDGSSEKMRIDSSGNLNIGETGEPSAGTDGVQLRADGTVKMSSTGSGERNAFEFKNTNGVVGKIVTQNSNTTYGTASDYRLKENVVAISDGITRLKQLKPSKFNFKVKKDLTLDGFLAHEVQSVVPEAISGEKDAVKEDGSIDPQGIDQSKLVPLLTAALQEAITEIETLKTKVAALEAA